MARRLIGQGVIAGGLAVLLLALVGVWDEAEADRGRRGRPQHHGFHGRHLHGKHFRGGHVHGKHFHGGPFHGEHFRGPRAFVGPRLYVAPRYSHYTYQPYRYYGGYYYGYVPGAVVVMPPSVVVTPPPTYRERPSASQYWHYCPDPAGYYPEVGECPGGWIQVPPR